MKVSGQTTTAKTSSSYYTSSRSAKSTEQTKKNAESSKSDKTNRKEEAADKSLEKKTYWEDKMEKDKEILASFKERTEAAKEAKKNSNSKFLKSSSSGESVGSYAALLAKAETKMEVMEVSSKVTWTLAELKMASVGSEGEEAKKLAKQIRRPEKLTKQIQKKLKNLSKEEQLELRKERAIKKMEMEKAQELHKELEKRRTKRRREDRKYAQKEIAEDMKNETANLLASTGASDPVTSSSLDAALGDMGGIDLSMSGFDGGMDILV